MDMVGWSDVVDVHTMCMGNCRLGSPILYELCHIIQFTSEFTRKLVKRSLEGEVYVFGAAADHLLFPRAFYGHLVGVKSGTYNQSRSRPMKRILLKGNNSFSLPLRALFFSIPAHLVNTLIHRYLLHLGWQRGKEQNAMASTDATEQILELLKKSPDAMAAIQSVLRTFCSASITKPDPGEFFPTDEDQYMALMMGALEYSIFPHAIKPTF